MASHTPDRPSPDDSADWEAIGRFFAGESSAEEAASVRRWLEAHPEEASALRALSDVTGQLASATPPDLDVEAALQRVTERRDAATVVPIDSRRSTTSDGASSTTPRRRWLRYALPAAAAAGLAIAAGLYWHSARGDGYRTDPGASARTLATTVGQRDSLRLADGTRILLAPASRITVAAGYGQQMREVELQGEAYFDVQHDAARPFVVRAGGAAIRDLGTTFTVRAPAGQPVRVAVTSGSVSLAASGARDSVVLRPGDAGTVTDDGRALVDRGGAVEGDTAWTHGRLVFREAPVPVIRAELQRWYGIDLVVDSSYASRHLSMMFEDEPVEHVLRVIALSLGGEVERQGNTAYIRPAPSRQR